MTPHHPAPAPAGSDACPPDRAALDEALFGCAEPRAEPTGYYFPPIETPQVVVDHVVPAEIALPRGDDPLPLEHHEAVQEEEEAHEEPAALPLVLAACTGLTLTAGDTVTITAQHLRITGGTSPFLIDILLLSAPEHGVLLRDGFALTGGDIFTQEDIDRGRLRYRHDGGSASADQFLFATPDEQVPATVFSITVEFPRRAPELTGPGQLATVLESSLVADILDGTASCCDPELCPGLALVGATGRGTWQYAMAGADWLDLGPISPARALLLGAADALRFLPLDGWSGTARLTYHAWDQSAGTVGELVDLTVRGATGSHTAFSRTTACASVYIAPVEEASVAEPWMTEPTLDELFGGAAAVIRVGGEGRWQFSADAGRTWVDFHAVYHGRARLLRGSDRVRFLPRPGAVGKVVLAARAWNGRGGSPGGTADLAPRRSHGAGTPFGEFVRTRTWWLRSSEPHTQ